MGPTELFVSAAIATGVALGAAAIDRNKVVDPASAEPITQRYEYQHRCQKAAGGPCVVDRTADRRLGF